MFFAFVAVLFAASALAVLSVPSRLTASLTGLAGWSVLAILGILGAGLAVMEATVQGDAGRIETYDTKDETMKGHGVRLACSC